MKIAAHVLVEMFGEKLVGVKIIAPACGEYPGGTVTVVELNPEPDDENIALLVHDDAWGRSEGSPEMCIFKHEICEVALRVIFEL